MVIREDLKRAVCIYLATVEMSEEWKKLADKAGIPVSKFVVEHVENSLRQEDTTEYPSRTELIKQLREKTEDVDALQKEAAAKPSDRPAGR